MTSEESDGGGSDDVNNVKRTDDEWKRGKTIECYRNDSKQINDSMKW